MSSNLTDVLPKISSSKITNFVQNVVKFLVLIHSFPTYQHYSVYRLVKVIVIMTVINVYNLLIFSCLIAIIVIFNRRLIAIKKINHSAALVLFAGHTLWQINVLPSQWQWKSKHTVPKDNCIPQHDVVFCRSTTNTCWWIFLQSAQNSSRDRQQLPAVLTRLQKYSCKYFKMDVR